MATQLVLDREHPNRLVFSPARGLDPLLDLRLRGAEVGNRLLSVRKPHCESG